MTKRVLIASFDQAFTDSILPGCQALGLTVSKAPDDLRTRVSLLPEWQDTGAPDLIILDAAIPLFDGWTICEQFCSSSTLALVPVIVVIDGADEAKIRQCEELGAHYVVRSADVWERIEPLVFELLDLTGGTMGEVRTRTAVPTTGATVLCIDDDYLFTEVLNVRLSSRGLRVMRAFNGLHGYWRALRERPDLIITDYTMPEGYGSYLLRRLRDHSVTKEIPVIVLTGRDLAGRPTETMDHTLERQLRNLGAQCVLPKPVDWSALYAAMEHHVTLANTPAAQDQACMLATQPGELEPSDLAPVSTAACSLR